MMLFALAAGTILAGLLINTLLNAARFGRLAPATAALRQPDRSPSVTVLVPARNEGKAIDATVTALLSQRYVNYRIRVLDDGSTDGTGILATAAARRRETGAHRFHLDTGAPLPGGWCGKNWACSQLAVKSESDILIFTDADVLWEPQALAAAVAALERQEADLLTVWPTQETITWSERLVVPLMAYSVLAYLPLKLADDSRYPSAAAANGQCLVFRRDAYTAIGGHAAVADRVLEDVELARRIKGAGLRLRMADAAGLIHCRMYHSWAEVRTGFAKNILAGHAGSIPLLLLSAAVHLALFVVPWLWLGRQIGLNAPLPTMVAPLLLILLGVAVRAVSAAATGQRVGDALLMPLSVLLMCLIAGQAIWWQLRYGGPRWKDRTVRRASHESMGHPLPPQS